MCCSTVPKQIENWLKIKQFKCWTKNDSKHLYSQPIINRNEPEDLNAVSYTYSSLPRSCLGKKYFTYQHN